MKFEFPRLFTLLAITICAGAIAGCSTAAPQPALTPIAAAPVTAPAPPDEWNVFPDFTTGTVDVYHNGEYYGSITGDEKEDPPIPRKREEQ